MLLIISLIWSCTNDDNSQLIGGGVFHTESGTAVIEGELFIPDGIGPFPSMIIIGGSGNEPRQEFEPFAELLNQNGYALYIYDKRGIGGSTGNYPAYTQESQTEFLDARAQDVIGILNLLKTHNQVDNNRIGLYGSSQGAWVNSVVYNLSVDISYLVMASGGVASTGLENFYCFLTDDPSVEIEEANNQLLSYDGPVGFDPFPIVKDISVPVLWIYGNEDRSHPSRYDVEILNQLNKSNFTIQLYENTDHDLLDLTTRNPPSDLYSNLGDWLLQNN